MRECVEITKESAAHVAKYFVKQQAQAETDFLRKMAMTSAVQDDGAIDQIANLLYDMGIKLSIDKSNPEHARWLADGAAVAETE